MAGQLQNDAHSNYVLNLMDIAQHDAERAGAKATRLGVLAHAGFPVPDGLVLTADAFDRFLAANALDSDISSEDVIAATLPNEIAAALLAAADAFDDLPLAVRSSAVAEDQPFASFAGQYETVLDVHGREALLAAVQRVFSSTFSHQVAVYRTAHGQHARGRMAVLVQHQVEATAAGVAFTANPVTGERTEVVISAVRGSGERLVSGQTTPDEWIVRNQEAMCRAAPEEAINANQVLAVAELARRVETHFGGIPQDIEWALVGDETVSPPGSSDHCSAGACHMESLAAGCLGTPHQTRRVAGRSGDAALRKLGASADRGADRRQHQAARWCPSPPTDAHARQRLVLLLAQLSPVKSRQHALEAPALRAAEGTGPAAPGSHDDALLPQSSVSRYSCVNGARNSCHTIRRSSSRALREWINSMHPASFASSMNLWALLATTLPRSRPWLDLPGKQKCPWQLSITSIFSRASAGAHQRLLCGLSDVSHVSTSHAVACLDWFHPTLGEL